ncbi:hypothetical protein F5B22DRAFT_632148 [Xylaria bambusicola]|uniref:uncharacterized protein n=1 Tax=Xylaria bambusicola TaxID=326684 RepID=UPI0020080A50|nr:uncharacterized protein F5B22DRAFT_632148 [Xylaria bambusicola]KAI0502754.1 hypothetical protein F5B22DRAFT_632148 [Xylaria bambusicola]
MFSAENMVLLGATPNSKEGKSSARSEQVEGTSEQVQSLDQSSITPMSSEIGETISDREESLYSSEKQDNSSLQNLQSIPGIAKMGWDDFNDRVIISPENFLGTWNHRPEVNDKPTAIIDVLVEEPGPYYSHVQYRGSPESRLNLPSLLDVPSNNFNAVPYQIRIRSSLLLKTLDHITDCKVAVGPHGHRLLLLRPFKLLVHFEQDIRSYVKEMERMTTEMSSNDEKGVHQERAANNQNRGFISSQRSASHLRFPTKETQSTTAMEHLKLLCTLMDECLSRPMQLQRGISPDITKVTFNDLWYIFKPGYEVRTPGDSHAQLYRVVKVTGGRKVQRVYQSDNHAMSRNQGSLISDI